MIYNKFFIGYRKSILEPNEVLLSINIPFTNPEQYFEAYKQARRREDDIAIVNAAVNVTFQPESDIISDINLAFGGMSYKTVTAPKTERQLRGLPWNEKSLEIAYRCLLEDLPLDPGAPGGMIPYRKSLTLSLFFKAFLAISQKLQKFIPTVKLHPRDRSGIDGFHSINFKSSQYFTVVPSTRKKTDSLQRPIVHMSAYKQATGEAVYCDDIPHQEGELHCAFVLSTKPHANILNIDQSEALAMEENRYKKRGLSIIPTKYGIAFTQSFMNQAGALVLVYTDGSVLLSHGGIEMGQGLYTKMIQVASRELDIPVEKIHISETATDKVPNTSPTAASSGSDLNGMAVMEACKIIKERLRPYREANPKGTWEQWVKTAYFDKVCLSAIGFYKINVGFDWNTKKGDLYNYFTYGVACTEVEIDTLTGDHQVLKTDIVMDIGMYTNDLNIFWL
ncbi:hypothetical protein NQ315_005756 [Exocentrus adspersus]|uniref:Xanthine dehydrogenase n=1 Tax=Exocentrus adspersus TaxID=1586481 RepID=A0AAV8VCE2_9CUCU|nr:hypothetical protein NQ315_005756 [Exocentrus adspersus]